ncbi:MAG: hypothetical protein BZY87_04030 [SAR202 cluster bacterium Io17-Chloro-G6]|nr:MAG: hypothetical protein BZY87_04030 [SAR202 cluster bacterium Io17-Chloro-G6]
MAQVAGGGAGSNLCSQCSEPLEPGANFCGHCGAAISSQERTSSIDQGAVATGAQRPTSPSFTGAAKSTDHITYRNMVMQVVLVIVTLGIYTLYWFYVTLDELHKANGKTEGSGMWTFLSLVPIAQYFAYWHQANEYTEFVNEKYPAIRIFILWIMFSPAVWFLVQSDLNQVANRDG